MSAKRRTFKIDELDGPITELLLAGDKALNTRSPLDRLAEWVEPCDECDAPKGEPCLPHGGLDRQNRGQRNHYAHKARRDAVAEHLSSLLAEAILSEAE